METASAEGLFPRRPADPRSEAETRNPSLIGEQLLDLDAPFDPRLLDRMAAWMAVTTGTAYKPAPEIPVGLTAAAGVAGPSAHGPPPELDWSAAPRLAHTPERSRRGSAQASSTDLPTLPVRLPLSVHFAPQPLGQTVPQPLRNSVALVSSVSALSASAASLSTLPRLALPEPEYRTELFEFPAAQVLADVVNVQSRFRARKMRRWWHRYRHVVMRVIKREQATTFQMWHAQAHVTSRYHRSLKRACFHALRSYTQLTARFFEVMASYMDGVLGRADYSAAAIWKLAQRRPVPGHEYLSTIPTYLYSSIFVRLYHQYSKDMIRNLRRNLRYWQTKREAARLMWKRAYQARARAVVIVWFRYTKVMIAERRILPIPTFDEQIREWDDYFAAYMRRASLTRKVASMSSIAMAKRAFRRLRKYLRRAGSRLQMAQALRHHVQFSLQGCYTFWADIKNAQLASRFFFGLLFRRWQRATQDAFRSLHLIERRLTTWVHRRVQGRCFSALRTWTKYSSMMAYAATRQIRGEHCKALNAIFVWQGDSWHVAMVDGWLSWRLYTQRRRALSTFVARHLVERVRELLLISFIALRAQWRKSKAKRAKAESGEIPEPLSVDSSYSMSACEDNGDTEARVVDHAALMFPDDDLDTALQRHRKLHFRQWRDTREMALLKRVVTFHTHQRVEAARVTETEAAVADDRIDSAAEKERQMLVHAKTIMKTAVTEHGSRAEVELQFRQELQRAAELRKDAQAVHEAIIARHRNRVEQNNLPENSNRKGKTGPRKRNATVSKKSKGVEQETKADVGLRRRKSSTKAPKPSNRPSDSKQVTFKKTALHENLPEPDTPISAKEKVVAPKHDSSIAKSSMPSTLAQPNSSSSLPDPQSAEGGKDPPRKRTNNKKRGTKAKPIKADSGSDGSSASDRKSKSKPKSKRTDKSKTLHSEPTGDSVSNIATEDTEIVLPGAQGVGKSGDSGNAVSSSAATPGDPVDAEVIALPTDSTSDESDDETVMQPVESLIFRAPEEIFEDNIGSTAAEEELQHTETRTASSMGSFGPVANNITDSSSADLPAVEGIQDSDDDGRVRPHSDRSAHVKNSNGYDNENEGIDPIPDPDPDQDPDAEQDVAETGMEKEANSGLNTATVVADRGPLSENEADQDDDDAAEKQIATGDDEGYANFVDGSNITEPTQAFSDNESEAPLAEDSTFDDIKSMDSDQIQTAQDDVQSEAQNNMQYQAQAQHHSEGENDSGNDNQSEPPREQMGQQSADVRDQPIPSATDGEGAAAVGSDTGAMAAEAVRTSNGTRITTAGDDITVPEAETADQHVAKPHEDHVALQPTTVSDSGQIVVANTAVDNGVDANSNTPVGDNETVVAPAGSGVNGTSDSGHQVNGEDNSSDANVAAALDSGQKSVDSKSDTVTTPDESTSTDVAAVADEDTGSPASKEDSPDSSDARREQLEPDLAVAPSAQVIQQQSLPNAAAPDETPIDTVDENETQEPVSASDEMQAMREKEQELLQRLRELGQSNRSLDSSVDDLKVKEALEADLKKFAGPDIYERNTYRAKVNEQALLSRVRKDQLYWLYQQAELALRRHASEVSRTPLPRFEIPVTGPGDGVPEAEASLPPTYESIAAYFSQIKEQLVSASGNLTDSFGGTLTSASGGQEALDEMSRLTSRFPSLKSRGSASRGSGVEPRSQVNRLDANAREGRTTHAADISQAAKSAWAGGGMGPPESYLYAFDSTMDRTATTCVHNVPCEMSCPECGTSDDIVMVPNGEGNPRTPAMITAISLERLRSWNSRVETIEDLEGNAISEPPEPSKDENDEMERRATFGGGGAAGRTRRHGKPVKGLTRAARSRPSTAPLPPLATQDESMQWEFSVLGSTLSSTSISEVELARKATSNGVTSARVGKKRNRRRVWKSPYQLDEGSARRGAPVLTPLRTAPSFGGGQPGELDITASGHGLVIPPHLVKTLLDVEALLDEGNVGGALEHVIGHVING